METPEQDHYAVIGLQLTATTRQIKQAYHKLAVKLHPDKNDNSEESTTAFQKLQKASEILLDPGRRRVYDIKYPVIKAEWARFVAAKENAAAPQHPRPEPPISDSSNNTNGPRTRRPKRAWSPAWTNITSSSSSRASPSSSEADTTDDEYTARPRSTPFTYVPRPDPRYEDGQPYTGRYDDDPQRKSHRPKTRRGFTDEDGHRQEEPSSRPRGREGPRTRSPLDQQGRQQRPRAPSWVDTEEGRRIRGLAAHVRRMGLHVEDILDDAADKIASGVPPGDPRIITALGGAFRELDRLGELVGILREDMMKS